MNRRKQNAIKTANANLTRLKRTKQNRATFDQAEIIAALEQNIIDCLAFIDPKDTDDPELVWRIVQRRGIG